MQVAGGGLTARTAELFSEGEGGRRGFVVDVEDKFNLVASEAAVAQQAYLPPVLKDLPTDGVGAGAAATGDRDEEAWLGGGNHLEESQPRLMDAPLEDWGKLVDDLAGRYGPGGGADDAAWIGAPGWPPLGTAGLEADIMGTMNGLPGMGGFGGACGTSEEDVRYWSGSSSCGSDSRAFRASAVRGPVRGGRPGSWGATSTRQRMNGGGIPDTCQGGPGDLGGNGPMERPGRHSRRSGGPSSGGAPIASPEMANCVQGVLARINEALTKLDSGAPQEADSTASGPSSTGQGQRPRTSNGESHRTRNRPHSARGAATSRASGTPRASTPRARGGGAPYGHAANSWA